MARAKDDPLLNQLFEGPAGGEAEAAPREALRREVLEILEAAGADAAAEPLDDGLIAAYLDNALEAAERAALEARLAASHVLRAQVGAAAEAREAGLKGGLAMPPAFAEAYDAVPAPSGPAAARDRGDRQPGFVGRFLGTPMPARRWLAATVPVLAAVVVAAVLAPQMLREDATPGQGEVADAAGAKRERVEERKAKHAEPAKRPTMTTKPRAPAKPKAEGRRIARQAPKVTGGTAGKEVRVLNTVIVPLSSELRNAMVALGRKQTRLSYSAPRKEAEKRAFRRSAPATGSSADKMLRKRKAGRSGGAGSQTAAGMSRAHIAVINKVISPGCPTDPAACCDGLRVDRDLLDRLIAGRPPLQTVKVVHFSSRACYLTLP
jgi:hypothetical protein